MLFRAGAQGKFPGTRLLSSFWSGTAPFRLDRRGIAAVEFAFIAPLLLAMYFVTMEVAQAIEANKKVNRLSSMVADLVAQQTDVSTSDLDAIMKIGDMTLQPYSRSDPKVVITAITISSDATPKATVAWSRKMENGSYSKDLAKNTEVSVKGRHDPCVGIRAVPIGEAMLAIVLADHYLRHRAQTGKG